MPATVLVTGFGPFPGAPRNPTQPLVRTLTRSRHPGARVIGHVFRTSYASVDRELPALLERHQPDILLMFGLHGRARSLRIETLAQNAVGRHRDATGALPKQSWIDPKAKARIALPAHARRLLRAVPGAILSRDAGKYLCNYLCWRASDAAKKPGGPRIAAFVHVPPVLDKSLPQGTKRLTPHRLEKAGAKLLAAISACR
ncbi:MAG: pyroglutamyl-peptidase I [Pseudolabrys sp.]|nr:pyroglutamyl-peptidase I [Pseudolabrys sp.]